MQRTARRQWHQIGYYYHRCVLRHRPCHRHPPCVMGFSNAGFGLRRAERGNLNFFVYVWPIFKLKSVKIKCKDELKLLMLGLRARALDSRLSTRRGAFSLIEIEIFDHTPLADTSFLYSLSSLIAVSDTVSYYSFSVQAGGAQANCCVSLEDYTLHEGTFLSSNFKNRPPAPSSLRTACASGRSRKAARHGEQLRSPTEEH
jgi:hypothetical protein